MKNKISATFTHGSADVTCTSASVGYPSFWLYQLRSDDYICPYSSTKNYIIQNITNNSHLLLDGTFEGVTTAGPFVMTSHYPLYDDDGHTGAKAISVKTDSFGLTDGDIFSLSIDGSRQDYTFSDASNPFMFYYDGNTVSQILNTNFTGLKSTVEWVVDSATSFGYNDALIIRTDGIHNQIIFHDGVAVSKLGFFPDSTFYGNNDTSSSNSEYMNILDEMFSLNTELSALTILLGMPEKVDRYGYGSAQSLLIQSSALAEMKDLTSEINCLNSELSSISTLLQEPSLPSYNSDQTAFINNSIFLSDCSSTKSSTEYVAYVPFIMDLWTLDFTGFEKQTILGKDSTGVAVPYDSGPGITSILGDSSFILQIDPSHDRRFWNSFLFYLDSSLCPDHWYVLNPPFVKGIWAGFDSSTVSYSNQITFNIDTTSAPLFLQRTDSNTHSYAIDGNGLTIDGTSFSYINYPTVGLLKTGIDSSVSGIDATGNSIFDTYAAGFMPDSTQSIPPDATIYFGLRGCYATYDTISDRNLTDRSSFDMTRINTLTNRVAEINLREEQIINAITNEQYFISSSDGSTGTLYEWANNRFNRSNGCEARLKQVEKQIEMNKSSLGISKNFI